MTPLTVCGAFFLACCITSALVVVFSVTASAARRRNAARFRATAVDQLAARREARSAGRATTPGGRKVDAALSAREPRTPVA